MLYHVIICCMMFYHAISYYIMFYHAMFYYVISLWDRLETLLAPGMWQLGFRGRALLQGLDSLNYAERRRVAKFYTLLVS